MTWVNGLTGIPSYYHYDEPSRSPTDTAEVQTGQIPTTSTSAVPPAQPLQFAATPATFVDAKQFTAFTVGLAADLLADARKKEALVNAAPPGSEAYDKALQDYRAASSLAMRSRSISQQAIAAELRGVYQGNPKNTRATENKAHEIGNRFKDDPETQISVKDALATVKSETAQERDTSIRLYEFHRAEHRVTTLQVSMNATGQVPAGYKEAVADYQAKRLAVMKAIDDELLASAQGAPTGAARTQAIDGKAEQLLDRYEGDEDLGRMTVAARIIRHVRDVGGSDARDTNTQQMLKLGELMPKTTDIVIRDYVMSDPAISGIVDRYVDYSAQSVTAAYGASVAAYKDDYSDLFKRDGYVPPATAAMNKLTELTDPIKHPEVTSQITARIINKLMAAPGSDTPGTLDRVIDDVSYAGEHTAELCAVEGAPDGWQGFHGRGDESWRAYLMPDKQKIITSLSLIADRAAAGSQPTSNGTDGSTGMQWESDETRTAVENMGKAIAFRMITDDYVRVDFNHGFQRAIAGEAGPTVTYQDQATGLNYDITYTGGVTLGLEVAHQEIHFQEDDYLPLGRSVEPHRDRLVSDTLDGVSRGLEDLKNNSRTLFDESHKKMSQLEVTQLGYGQRMTLEQQQGGYNKVMTHAMVDPHDEQHAVEGYQGALAGFIDGRMDLDQRGYEVKRADDMVDLYGTLARTPDDWNTEVNGTYQGDNKLAGREGFQQVVDRRNALVSDDQVITLIAGSDSAQLAAKDKAVHASLNWMRDSGVVPPAALGPVPLPLFLQWAGDFKEHFVEDKYLTGVYGGGISRLGNAPALAHVSWGAVGAGQLWLTAYLYHNVSFPKGEEWRKDALLLLVGGFAGIKAYQSGTLLAHQGAQALQKLPQSLKNILDRTGKLSSAEEFFRQHSEFTRTAGWKSIGFFGLLHIDAAIWDASRVWGEYKNMRDGRVVDQRNLWTALGNLSADWATAGVEIRVAYGLFKFPTPDSPALKAAIARGETHMPMVLAEEGGQLYKSRMAKFGLGLLKGPGFGYDFASKLLVGGLEKLGVRAGLAAIPGAGTLAAIVWTANDLINWLGNEKKVHKLLETIDMDFLTGAKIDERRAKILADRSLAASGWETWLQASSLADGLLSAYTAVGGDPDQFVNYVNDIPEDSLRRLRDGLRVAKDAADPLPEVNEDDYWMLPTNPDDPAQRQFNYNLHYNQAEHRWEDTHLRMFCTGHGRWMSIDNPYSDKCRTFSTQTHVFERGMGNDVVAHPSPPKSVAGIRTWMLGNGMPLPPQPAGQEPVDTSATDPLNVYIVRDNDSVYGIAGNDLRIVQWIYDHNLWLNQRMQADRAPRNRLPGQNPNYINTGELLILPPGYRPPQAS